MAVAMARRGPTWVIRIKIIPMSDNDSEVSTDVRHTGPASAVKIRPTR
jgi:hypothetical protein